MSLNKVLLIGHIGSDPITKTIFDDRKVCEFSLATNKKYKDKEKSTTEWHKVITFDKLAEISEKYLKSGSKIYLEGCIQYKKYSTKEGIEKNITQIVASSIEFLDKKIDDIKNNKIEISYKDKIRNNEDGFDDIPF